MDKHEKWLSRRVYHETFSTSVATFPLWRGVPNRCNCGCGGMWYDKLSPINQWASFNPVVYISMVPILARVFIALHKLLWHLPPMIWIWFMVARTTYMIEVRNRAQPGPSTTVAMATARMFLYGIKLPLTVVAWTAAWVISRPGVVLMIPLYLLALAAIMTVLAIPLLMSIIAISLSGLVFILGGVGSILYLDNPAIGIALIVIGVLVQYEQQRRESRRREEQLGYLIRTLRPETQNEPRTAPLRHQ